MEAIEIVVYLALALMVGVLVLQFLTSWDFMDTYDRIRGMMVGDEKSEFKTVDREEFVAEAFNFWKSCGMGEVEKSLAVYVDDEGTLNAAVFFAAVKKMNLCESLQSAAQDCGSHEYVEFRPVTIDLPRVIGMECDPISEKLIIEGG